MRTVNVGLIGLGTVGGGVARLIRAHHDDYVSAHQIDLQISKACALQWEQAEAAGISKEAFTTDWKEVVSDPSVDIVVELIGGEHPATEIFETAFANGKHVVSANKALLGRHVESLAKKAHENNVQLKCEASCGGGIPIVSTLEHDLIGNEILTIAGILNGTTNYILSRMTAEGADYADVLADAQAKGYAEADPSADVDGFDAASKTAILASIGFETRVTTDDVYQQGIRTIGAEDIAEAKRLGYVIKLLGIARNTPEGVDVRVHPTMIPKDHQLAAVNGAMNAVYVVGDAVGETMFYGAGAGSFPTASAVVGDVLTLAEQISRGVDPLPESEPFGHNLSFKSIDSLETRYYVRLKVADRTGALAEAITVFANHNIGIANVSQLDDSSTDSAACTVVLITHKALEADMQAAAAKLAELDGVSEVANVIRIEDTSSWMQGVMAN